MRIWYRARQFWQALRVPPFTATAQADVDGYLTAAEQRLFAQFPAREQWHSYGVMCTLRDAGHTEPDLLTAALLHDIGKSKAPLSIMERVIIVLADAFFGHRAAAWGQGEARGWRRPFVIKQQHPRWGAELARAAGSRPQVVSLIRRHQESLTASAADPTARLLRQLQWADEQH